MNDIPIMAYKSNIELYNDEYLFEMIVEYYIKYKETKKINLWNYNHFIDFEKDGVDDDIDDNNYMNLSLIKNMLLVYIIPIHMILKMVKIVLRWCTFKI